MDYTNTKEPNKVIDGLKICSNTSRSCCDDNCPYYKSYTSCQKTEILQDALILLKEQEQTIENLKEKLRLLEYGDQGCIAPAT